MAKYLPRFKSIRRGSKSGRTSYYFIQEPMLPDDGFKILFHDANGREFYQITCDTRTDAERQLIEYNGRLRR